MNLQKLINIQRDLNAPKSQYNKFGKFYYRSCEDILGAVKPLCAKEGAAVNIQDAIEVIGTRIYVKATAKLLDGETGNVIAEATAYAREAEQKAGMDDSQITGTASSYARKYALNGLFAIDDAKDADSDETSQSSENKPVQSQSHKPVQKPAQGQNKPLTLKEALQEQVEIKGTTCKLKDLNEAQLDWLAGKATGRTKAAAELIIKERFESALEDEQGEIPFK